MKNSKDISIYFKIISDYRLLVFVGIIFFAAIAFITYVTTERVIQNSFEKTERNDFIINELTLMLNKVLEENDSLSYVIRTQHLRYDNMNGIRSINKLVSNSDTQYKSTLAVFDSVQNLGHKTENYFIDNKWFCQEISPTLIEFKEFMLKVVQDTSITVYKDIDILMGFLSLEDINLSCNQTFNVNSHLNQAEFYNIKLRTLLAYHNYLNFICGLSYFDYGILQLGGYFNQNKSFFKIDEAFNADILIGAPQNLAVTVYVAEKSPYFETITMGNNIEYRLIDTMDYKILPVKLENGRTVFEIPTDTKGLNEFGGLVHFKTSRHNNWIPFYYNYYVK
jgi:hypothetical protein